VYASTILLVDNGQNIRSSLKNPTFEDLDSEIKENENAPIKTDLLTK
jgi:hypothetical protein